MHGFRYYFTPLTGVLFTFPSRYLFTIGRQLVFSLTPWSAQIHAAFHVCRATQGHPRAGRIFSHGPFTLYGMFFHTFNLILTVPHRGPTTPGPEAPVWAVPLSLATTYGIDSLSFPPLTEMFHFSGFSEPALMDSEQDDAVLTASGYPIRKSPGQSVFAAIRGLSQLITSFIACWHQGIRHALLTACFSRSLKLSKLVTYRFQPARLRSRGSDARKLHLFLPCMQLSKNRPSHPDDGTCQTQAGMVGLTGFEPVTPRLSSVCSNQLSYRPEAIADPSWTWPAGAVPRPTWRQGDSNP